MEALGLGGEVVTDAEIHARIVQPDMTSSELELFQVAPGRYEASLEVSQIGSYMVNIFQEGEQGLTDQVSTGFSVSYPPEYEKTGPDLFLLSQLAEATGGKLGIKPEEVFRHTSQPVTSYQELWWSLLAIAVCLLPLDIAVRRFSFTGESVEYMREKVGEFLRALASVRRRRKAEVSHIAELKKIKEQYSSGKGWEGEEVGVKYTEKEVNRRFGEFSRGDLRKETSAEPPSEKLEDVQSSLERLKRVKRRVWGEDGTEEKEQTGL